jgi:hypothetical protein
VARDMNQCRVRFAAGARYVSLVNIVRTGPGAQPAFYTMDTGGCSFPRGKVAGA